MEQQEYLTLEEFARMSRLHLDTVRRYVREGRIQAHKVGKRYLIRADVASGFMDNAAVPQPKPTVTAKPRKTKTGRKRITGH